MPARGGGGGVSALPAPSFGGLHTNTPEDRQRAVAQLLSRGESFSLQEDDENQFELTPDKSDEGGSPNSRSPASSRAMAPPAASAPVEISFLKEEVAPVKPTTSGLAGIHRPSQAVGRPVLYTPNRYSAAPAPPEPEFSSSGQRARNRLKLRVFLPTRANTCMQLELKKQSTAGEAVLQLLTQYLRAHPQPDPAMLGQPAAYRLRVAEDDGEVDDDCPPLDSTCVVSTTGADCLTLQKRAAPAPPTGSSAAAAAAGSIAPASLAPPSAIAPRAQHPPIHMRGAFNIGASAAEHSQSDNDPFRDPDADPTARPRGASSYLDDLGSDGGLERESSPPPPPPIPSKLRLRGSMATGGSGKAIMSPGRRQSQRTSSDADEEYAQAIAEREADEDEQRRIRLAQANGEKPLGRTQQTPSSYPNRSSSFAQRFSLKSCLRCACFSAAPTEDEQPPPSQRANRL
jgi:hypothetical protein